MLHPAKQGLQLRRRGLLRPRSPVPPEHEPRLQPRPHLPQRSWPAHPRALLPLSLLFFFPSQLLRSTPLLPSLVPCPRPASLAPPLLHDSGATSRTKTRTTPAPNADASPRHCALDTPPSPVPLSPACSSAPPTSATHTAAPALLRSPLPGCSSLLARSPVPAGWSPGTRSSSWATAADGS